jgi:outer membrane autotransporter protein
LTAGVCNLANGTLRPGGAMTVRPGGVVNQTGGIVDGLSNTILLTEGEFNLRNGTVRPGNTMEIRSGGTFTQTGGIVDGASNTIAIFEGTCNVSGGEYRADTLNIHTNGSFNWTGGSFTYNRLYLDGGSFTGNLTNRRWLGGRGTLNGAVTNQGTVSPGASAGTLQVVGSFSQSAAGRYVCEIASASSYDRIVVTGTPGTAALNGVLAPTLLGGFQPARGQLFPGILTAAGGITGTFAQVESSNLWKVIYHPTSVDLMAFPFRDFTDPNLGLTWNQFQVGQMLNGLTATAQGDLETVLGALSDLPDQQVPKGLQKLTPDQNASLANLSFAASRMQGRSLIDRMNFLRQGESAAAGNAGGRLGGRPGLSASRLNGVLLAYNGASLSGLFSGRPSANRQPWGLFANFVGTLGTQDTTARQIGYSYNIFGFNTGLDYRLRPDLIIGGATGYYHTSSWFKDNGGEATVHSIPFYLYGVYHPGNFYLTGSLGYTLNLYKLDRTVAFGTISRTAQSSLSASQLNLAWETGYDLALARLIITPAANLFYSTVWLPAYTETGAGSLNLRVEAQTADSLQTGIGARCRYPATVGGFRITPQFSAFYQHEFANASRTLDARLSQAGGAFSFQTEAPTRNFAVLGAGLEVQCGEKFFLQATYNAEVGREHTTAHYLNAGLRWEF